MVIRLSGLSGLHYNWLLISHYLSLMFIPVDIDKSLYFPLRLFGLSIYTGTILREFQTIRGNGATTATTLESR